MYIVNDYATLSVEHTNCTYMFSMRCILCTAYIQGHLLWSTECSLKMIWWAWLPILALEAGWVSYYNEKYREVLTVNPHLSNTIYAACEYMPLHCMCFKFKVLSMITWSLHWFCWLGWDGYLKWCHTKRRRFFVEFLLVQQYNQHPLYTR